MNTENDKQRINGLQDGLLNDLLGKISEQEQQASDDRMLMSLKIYNRMKELGLNQTQFAAMAGKQVSVISKWLSGTHNFTMETLTLISGMLNIRLLDLEEQPIHRMELTIKGDEHLKPECIDEIINSVGGMAVASQSFSL
ncbi:helix-turn-helix domain-containing protein [Filimonas effusa]|uniref:XRE family transcriptional regulator n=1 Tax=Filimonas effusa TaxID=2508721 RepID=A0A4Q1D8Q6_9BACT|nr:helix-turn-helix transcriptional regulator [Filimonas effusa]RXK85590.1 XRE family transcriptional regulator [Filimonas effusa]